MRLLHTSDWHLGLTLEGMPMLDHQRDAIDFIVRAVQEHEIDAVLISGDIYDRSLPPIEAVALFEDGLVALARHCTVVVTSGNHDSAVRLGFGSRLFADRVQLRTSLDRIADPVTLTDEFGPVHIYGIPYLEPDLVRHKLAAERSHEAVLAAALAQVKADLQVRESTRSVVMAHAFVVGSAGAARSDSERDIRVGGVDSVGSHLFDGIDYAALGHLHGPQEPAHPGHGVVRYSGSPLRYSFSEAGHVKSLTIVDFGPDGVKSVSVLEVPQPRPMAVITGSLADLVDPDRHSAHDGSWVKAVVTDPVRPQHMHARLKGRFDHLVVSLHDPVRGPTDPARPRVSAASDPMDVVLAFIASAMGRAATPAETTVVREQYEALRREGTFAR